jgi:voltage-gated potassium channel
LIDKIFTFIFLVAGFYMNIEVDSRNDKPLQFHQTIYFLVVTMSTVGYGDLHPTTAAGEITITIAICIGAIILIPYYVSNFLVKINNYSPYKTTLTSVAPYLPKCSEF